MSGTPAILEKPPSTLMSAVRVVEERAAKVRSFRRGKIKISKRIECLYYHRLDGPLAPYVYRFSVTGENGGACNFSIHDNEIDGEGDNFYAFVNLVDNRFLRAATKVLNPNGDHDNPDLRGN